MLLQGGGAIMTPHDHAMELAKVLQEFAANIEVVGPKEVGLEWPDLLITFNKARAALAQWENHARLTSGFGTATRDPTTGEML